MQRTQSPNSHLPHVPRPFPGIRGHLSPTLPTAQQFSWRSSDRKQGRHKLRGGQNAAQATLCSAQPAVPRNAPEESPAGVEEREAWSASPPPITGGGSAGQGHGTVKEGGSGRHHRPWRSGRRKKGGVPRRQCPRSCSPPPGTSPSAGQCSPWRSPNTRGCSLPEECSPSSGKNSGSSPSAAAASPCLP